MPESLFVIFNLYWPPTLAVLMTVFFLFLKRPEPDSPLAEIHLTIPFVKVPFRVRSFLARRSLMGGLAAYFILFSVFRDYSTFFPKELKMEVFYDQAGLDDALKVFTVDELRRAGCDPAQWKDQAAIYSNLDAFVQQFAHIPQFGGFASRQLFSTGETKFVTVRVSAWHTYHVTDARGELRNALDAPGHAPVAFYSFFEKVDTRQDYITPSPLDLFLRNSVVIAPRFKQYVAENRTSSSVQAPMTLLAVTKIKVLPRPFLSQTVYFAERSGQTPTPFAYAIYKF